MRYDLKYIDHVEWKQIGSTGANLSRVISGIILLSTGLIIPKWNGALGSKVMSNNIHAEWKRSRWFQLAEA